MGAANFSFLAGRYYMVPENAPRTMLKTGYALQGSGLTSPLEKETGPQTDRECSLRIEAQWCIRIFGMRGGLRLDGSESGLVLGQEGGSEIRMEECRT